MREPISCHFKVPSIGVYNGTIESYDYLENFKALMMLQEASDALMCKSFPTILQSAA